ncbi:RNA polymerase sigma factor [Roseibium sp.]|uniref:RNA polymerase sigma factor n=1 Tax=Roseibium sp. TaxID=1936156 RepID=UPI003D13E181
MPGLKDIEILLPEMRAYATSISRSADEAEDLVQDAVERTLRAPDRPGRLRDLRPWIFRVIRNLHFDELRKRRVRREYSATQRRLSREGDGTRDRERDILLRFAFEKLSPDFREILFLIDVMNLKYAETAEIIGVPKGTVMSRVSRARRALLELVDGKDCTASATRRK